MKNVYVVTFDTYEMSYGTAIVLVGVYSSRERAIDAISVLSKKSGREEDRFDINEIELDETYSFTIDNFDGDVFVQGTIDKEAHSMGWYIE